MKKYKLLPNSYKTAPFTDKVWYNDGRSADEGLLAKVQPQCKNYTLHDNKLYAWCEWSELDKI